MSSRCCAWRAPRGRSHPRRGGATGAVVRPPPGTTLVVRGTKQRPRVTTLPGYVTLLFPGPVALARPVEPGGELLAGELDNGTLTLRLAPGIEVASTYPLEDPPRFVLRLAKADPGVPRVAPNGGPP